MNPAEKFEWWFRVDDLYIDQFDAYVKKHDSAFEYFCALESATNDHWQGYVRCTLAHKEKLSKAIVTPGRKNGKAFAKRPNQYDNILAYTAKGTGGHGGTVGEPPSQYRTNMPSMTKEHIAKLHYDYHSRVKSASSTINVYNWKGPSTTAKPRKTVFAKLCEKLEVKYDHINKVLDDPKSRRVIGDHEAYDLTMEVYNDDIRLAGTGVRERCVEEVLYRYGATRFRLEKRAKFFERQYKPY